MNSPVNLYELFGAESLQHDDEQSTADGWSFLAATHLACVGIGATLVALAWVIVWS